MLKAVLQTEQTKCNPRRCICGLRQPNHDHWVLIFITLWLIVMPKNLAAREVEPLGRGVVALAVGQGRVYVSWRLLATDPNEIAFNLYRAVKDAAPVKLNEKPIIHSTDFTDASAPTNAPLSYHVRPIVDGHEQGASQAFTVKGGSSPQPYVSIPLQTLPGYRPNDASVGDLDGDGEYEIVLHQAGRGRDNSQRGETDPPILEAYKLDGTFLWRISLGKNIREGAHYTQFIVYDLDGDGRAEVACKTADGTVDGAGEIIGDPEADHRNPGGYVLAGPEYLTVFAGATGVALATTEYIPPRGEVSSWGDNYGNRVDRFLACVAYLDGQRPSLVMCRGYYTRAVMAAWNWREGRLSHLWTFDSHHGTPGNLAYAGQGNHGLSVGDVDGDGKDEIVYGSCTIDDDGTGLYATGLGHGDALHLSDLNPERPGLEVFAIHERAQHPNGVSFRDARSGAVIWGKPSPDVGRGLAADIDPRYPGCEMWASGANLSGIWNVHGEKVSEKKPRSCNFAVWWDGDLLREILDRTTISKWDWERGTEVRLLTAEGCTSVNGSKATPALSGDILGDWREEVVWPSLDGKELRIYSTTIPSQHRLPTLMHDPQYRLSIAWQNVAYNQPPHPGFFLGHGMRSVTLAK